MDIEDNRTIGQRLRRIREAREKGLRVIAGLVGMDKNTLSRIENGERPVGLKELVDLANVLRISPSQITSLPIPAPANGHTDSATEGVRLALDAIDTGRPGGEPLPAPELRRRVVALHRQLQDCRFTDVATALPAVIRDAHTTLDTGVDRGTILELAVCLHTHVTRLWLAHAGAPTDLVRRSAFLARRLAHESGGLVAIGMASFGAADVLLTGGAFSLARAELTAITLPSVTPRTAGLVSYIIQAQAMIAALEGRAGDVTAPMDAVGELVERCEAPSEADPLGFSHSPAGVGTIRMWLALEMDDPDEVVRVARTIKPEEHTHPMWAAHYWMYYGRALARLTNQRDRAVMALRKAEELFPTKVLRDPMVRDTLTQLTGALKRDAVGRELAAMAYRAGVVTN